MKKTTLFSLCFGVSLAVFHSASNAQTPLLYYSFEGNSLGALTDNAAIDNLRPGADGTFHAGTLGGSATIFNGGVVSGGNLGRSLQFSPAGDGNQNLEAPNIDTAFNVAALGITPSTPYTAMAWLNFASTAGDNMIFGQNGAVANGGQVLHNGSRNGNYHSGHWGDDAGPDQGLNFPTGTGAWHHVAYTNDAAGLQQIYVDGVPQITGGAGTAGAMDLALNLLIGTSNNGGSFSGGVDEIKIYDQLLTQAQIQQAAVIPVPEPSSIALIAMSGLAAGFFRRRRHA
jgi:hypothetical protein